jgi:GNAT superfamily N-acetyltransferase
VSQPPDLVFRVADRSLVDRLLVLMAEFYAYGDISYDETVARAALQELLADPRLGAVWLVEQGEESVGYAVLAFGFSLELGGRDAILDELYVRERHRGIGVGRRTLAVVEAGCRERGIRALHLEVDETDERAQRFYAKAGFRSRLVDARNYLMTKRLTRA